MTPLTPERIEERQRMVASERERIEKRMEAMGVAYHASEANFIPSPLSLDKEAVM